MLKIFIKFYKSLRQCTKGVITIEMAIITPIIVMIILSSADLIFYILAQQKISRASYVISNLVTQMDEGVTESQISDMMLSIGEVTKPFDFITNGRATVTAVIGVGADGSAPDSYVVAWKRCYGDSASSGKKNYGHKGAVVSRDNIPENMILSSSQILVVTDIVYDFTPVIGFLDLSKKIEYLSYFRPRLGSIEKITGNGGSQATC